MQAGGRWTGITVVTPIPRWWRTFLRFNFRRLEKRRRLRKHETAAIRDLKRLAFIAFAHWGILETPGPIRRLSDAPPAYLVFQSNFNGAAEQYIEAFARVMPNAMRGLWGGAAGVPPPQPVTPFLKHILETRLIPDHYYCAYPEGTTKTIQAGLELRERYARLEHEARGIDAELFAQQYRDFLTETQHLF